MTRTCITNARPFFFLADIEGSSAYISRAPLLQLSPLFAANLVSQAQQSAFPGQLRSESSLLLLLLLWRHHIQLRLHLLQEISENRNRILLDSIRFNLHSLSIHLQSVVQGTDGGTTVLASITGQTISIFSFAN